MSVFKETNGATRMRLGISSYAFGWSVGVPGYPPPSPFSEHDLIDFAKRFGLHVVQFGDHVPLHTFTAARLSALKNAAAAARITLEIGARGLTIEHLNRYVALARELDAPLVRFVIDGPNYEPATDDAIAIVREALPSLASANVTLGIENHDRFPARTLRDMIEKIGSAQVGICLDTANSLGAGEGLGHVLDQLAPHTVNLHVKDFVISRVPYAMGFTITGRPAGQGVLDVVALRDAVATHGRCRSAILETWTPPETTIAATIEKERRWAEESVAYLKPRFE
jgi:sugar phosphate isomerase/epimerase